MGSRILTLDSNGQRIQKLSDWICEHEGVHFQYPSEKTTEAEEPTGSNDLRSDHYSRDGDICKNGWGMF